MIKIIGKEQIVFQQYEKKVLKSLSEIMSCQENKKNKYCLTKKDKVTQLIIPIHHLVTGMSNEKLYYERIADELVRNRFTQRFMFYPDNIIYSESTEYSIHTKEFIVPKPILTPEYFEGLIPFSNDKYARVTTFDTNNPQTKPRIHKVWKD
jgi:hypothetical protein